MVSDNSPEGVFWECAVVCTAVRSFQPVSGIGHYHTKSCYWLLCANGNLCFSTYLRAHLACESTEVQWKRKLQVLLGSGQQRWSLSITSQGVPQAQLCCDRVKCLSPRWENCAVPSAQDISHGKGSVFSLSPSLCTFSFISNRPSHQPFPSRSVREHRGRVYLPAE